ncbi:diguanylate cyclase (GGDEF)-like protein/PAS domain S-box-containing protein [Acetoanaerobium pronyense]|uniref:Diguanylate cyclase (GGDEF)-like protein/PAS domain S-box-containing protein n=1 Tax=Acetoanaerobium pronyense TaxID=1482736 RepID=A0ABS4KGL1_9FIRM|nr:sensor domain-containing diguanylate cyclase [Acetoanaerobium pronyense]MBP2026490.1 diguanylate cyclase (GGDEF)-like protein/PAS domain S-box-containing protein [Acetoanaerobium pronyense]
MNIDFYDLIFLIIIIFGFHSFVFLYIKKRNGNLTDLIKKERSKFFTILEASPDSIVVTRFSDGKIILANKKFLDTTKYTKDEIIGRTSLELNIWTNNLSRNRFINQLRNNTAIQNFEEYFYTKDRTIFLGSVSSNILTLDCEQYIVSIIRDITELKKTESRLIESEQKYKAIALSSASWEAWYDEHGWLLWTNDMVKEITGYDVDETFEINDIMRHIVIPRYKCNITKRFVNELSKDECGKEEFKINHKISGERWVLLSWRPVYDENQIFKGIRTSVIDISDQKKAEFAARDLASQLRREKEIAEKNSLTDSMTGLSNRRYLEDRICYEYSRMKRCNIELSIIMIDVDFFKQYNDTFGHLEGDECLKIISKLLKKSVKRGTDLVARYGGEEFVILLPDTSNRAAFKIANKLKNNIESLEIPNPLSEVSDFVTVSIGVATFNNKTSLPPNHLLSEVDKALYFAKGSGRNIVINA